MDDYSSSDPDGSDGFDPFATLDWDLDLDGPIRQYDGDDLSPDYEWDGVPAYQNRDSLDEDDELSESHFSFWDGDFFWTGDDSDDGEILGPPKFGELIERLKLKEEEEDCKTDGEENVTGNTDTVDMWLMLPDDVTVLIMARLPFPSLFSFRSVCKKWNALAANLDPTQMVNKNSAEVPFCIMFAVSNQFASYNPLSHCWHDLPASFASSFGVWGANCYKSRVLGGSGGLLLLESFKQELWVFNPINKSKRLLPPQLALGDRCRWDSHQKVHFHFDEVHASLMVFKYGDVIFLEEYEDDDEYELNLGRHEVEVDGLDLQIYDPKSDAWLRVRNCFSLMGFSRILSTVEFDGGICCLYKDSVDCHMCVFVDCKPGQANPRSFAFDIIGGSPEPEPPRRLRAGQLFVKDENLLLGGVVGCSLSDGQQIYSARVWKIDYDGMDWSKWHLLAQMPIELTDALSFHSDPNVAVQGDYMWVTTEVISDEDFSSTGQWSEDFSSTGQWSGVMCHIPSNSWWKVPNCRDSRDSPSLKRDVSFTEHRFPNSEVYCSRSPFFLNPRMDLVL